MANEVSIMSHGQWAEWFRNYRPCVPFQKYVFKHEETFTTKMLM